MLITLVGISIISWVVITQAPGSPIALTMDPKVSPKVIEQMMKNYDLDKPIYQQYYLWLKKLFTGKLYSFKDGRPVMEKISERIGNTLLLNLVATIIIFSLAIPLGIFSARRQYSFLDHLGTFGAYLGISTPGFWIAYLLILETVMVFGYPVLGMRSFVTEGFHDNGDRSGSPLAPAAPFPHYGHSRYCWDLKIYTLKHARSDPPGLHQDGKGQGGSPRNGLLQACPEECVASHYHHIWVFDPGPDWGIHHHRNGLCLARDRTAFFSSCPRKRLPCGDDHPNNIRCAHASRKFYCRCPLWDCRSKDPVWIIKRFQSAERKLRYTLRQKPAG